MAQPSGGNVGRLGRAVAAAVTFVPISIVFTTAAPPIVRLVVVAFFVTALVKPAAALLILGAFVPLGDILAGKAGLPLVRGGELLVLLFLAAWLLRSTVAPRSVPRVSDGLRLATLSVVTIILASLVVWLSLDQARTTYPDEYVRRFVRFMAQSYLTEAGPETPLVDGFWLIEGLGVLFAVRSLAFGREDVRQAVVRMVVVGGVGAAALSIENFSGALLHSTERWHLFTYIGSGLLRITGHVKDVNAAGSAFAMTIVLALGLAVGKRTTWGWTVAIALAAIALWLSGSRAAVFAVLVIVALGGWRLRTKGTAGAPVRRLRFAALGAVAAIAILIAVALPNLMIGPMAAASLRFRYYFLQTSLRILALDPIFGVGLGRYRELSPAFMPAPLLEVYRAENAHNYFLQMACELGVVGGIAFAVCVVAPLARAFKVVGRTRDDVRLFGIVGAAIAFLITALSGHPFLTPLVVFPFWIVLGLAASAEAERAGEPAARARPRWMAAASGLLIVVFAATLPFRIARERRHLDFSNVAYGVNDWEEARDGTRYRWTGPRARLFVPASARAVEIPMRILQLGSHMGPTTVRIGIDGREANEVTLSDDNWRRVRLLVPGGSGRQFRQIDLAISPTWSPAADDPNSPDRRQLGVVLGELKVTKIF